MINEAIITAYDDSKDFTTNTLTYDVYGIINITGIEDDLYETSFEQHVKHATKIWNHLCFSWPSSYLYSFKNVQEMRKNQ